MNTTNYIKIDEILSRLLRNPMLEGTTKEQVISYLVDFIGICKFIPLYEHREDTVKIKDYRGILPCDVISVDMVKDTKTGFCMRSMTDSYLTKNPSHDSCCMRVENYGDKTWKIQGNIIYTSFKEGSVEIAYSTIPTDEDGFPLLMDNSKFLKAFELYIKKEIYSNLMEQGKLNINILNHTEQQYAWAVGQLQSEMVMPDMSEMQSIMAMMTSMFQNNNHFHNGFRNLGIGEQLKVR